MEVYCSPNTEDIEEFLKNKVNTTLNNSNKILHIVPTMILLRRRIRFYRFLLGPNLNLKNVSRAKHKEVRAEIRRWVGIYEVDEFIRSLVYQSGMEVLSKTESAVILERVLKANPDTNDLSWLTMIPHLIELFRELALTGLSVLELKECGSSERWKQVIDIYATYLEETEGALDFGQAGRMLLQEKSFHEYDELVMDGSFLPILGKHHLLIEKFKNDGKNVTFLLPCDLSVPNHPAFEAIFKAYEPYVPREQWQSIQQPRPASFFVDRFPKLIFTETASTHLDQSFSLTKFYSVEDELTYIVQRIAGLAKKNVNLKKIAIITPQFMEIRPLVREMLEQYGVPSDVPRRPLLHLPQGRALKSLYDISLDPRGRGEPYLDLDMVRVIMHGNVIKGSPELVDVLENLAAFFTDCTVFDDWYRCIDSLIEVKEMVNKEEHLYHPVAWTTREELTGLRKIISRIQDVSKQLISGPTDTINNHVQNLLRFLKTDENLIPFDEELLERLESISRLLDVQNRLTINSLEFGARLTALFVEQEGDVIEVTSQDETELALEAPMVTVTGPGNVEFQRYDYVFLCRFTQDMYPEVATLPWPMTSEVQANILAKTTENKIMTGKDLDEFYTGRALYHIYSAMNAAKVQLNVSYSQVHEGMNLTPAHYLHDIARVIGLEEEEESEDKPSKTIEEVLEEAKVLRRPSLVKEVLEEPPAESSLEPITDKIFTVEDVAIYQYCPRRLYLQKKHPEHLMYKSEFHLQSYAASFLYGAALKKMIKDYSKPMSVDIESGKIKNKLLRNASQYRQEAEKEVRPLFPFSRRLWATVRLQADLFLQSLIRLVFEHDYVKEQLNQGNISIRLQWRLIDRQEEIRVNDFIFQARQELEIQYNNARKYYLSTSNRQEFLYFTSRNELEREAMEKIKDWYFELKRHFFRKDSWAIKQLQHFVDMVKANEFPKQVGGHCMYCPYQHICQERNVSNAYVRAEESN
ncbi:MAG: hypothetical protein H0Z24_08915 [Thermosipho sp. (in: Bacteria)]|nr:hypothetical protein [Thermosipho sp. (in: thermotogales)]